MPRPCVVIPAQALLRVRRLAAGARLARAVAVRLADGVAAGGQGHGFFVVHRHAGKGDAHVRAVLSGSGWPSTPSGLT